MYDYTDTLRDNDTTWPFCVYHTCCGVAENSITCLYCVYAPFCFRCLYISGVPGTGKTATVHEVMCSLKEAEEEGLVPQFKFVEINGMRMTDPYQTYPLIWKVCVVGG